MSSSAGKEMFKLDKYKKTTTLSTFFGKKFEKDTAYTIRCGGRRSAINNRHNWDGYMVDGEEYRLTIESESFVRLTENLREELE